MLNSVNPAIGKLIRSYPEMTIEEVNKIIYLVNDAFKEWKETTLNKRAKLMLNSANVLREQIEELSKLMTEEMGKPIAQSRAEIEKCAWICEYYTANAEKFLEDELIETDAAKSFVTYQPLGVVLAVMPWNFPFWQVFRFAAPGLMAGNAGLLKHSSNVSGCALAIEEIFRKAGFPENLFRIILLPSSDMDEVIKNKIIKAVTLTGSVPAGKAVAAAAGSVLKKTVLELGGSDPYIVLEDADLQLAADNCTTARLINGGQSCIAAKRFIVVEKIYDEFEKIFVKNMQNKKMGDPFDETNDVGPQASKVLREELHQ